VASGEIVAVPGDKHASDDQAMTLRWTADGHWLAFTWNGTSIRLLNAAGTSGDDLGFMRDRRFSPLPASGNTELMAELGFSYLTQ
jgi:hypothetical protein